MERNREARRGTIPATANGLSRRRQRNSSLRDSPEEDGGALELQEMARLRDRASKKDRDRDRDRDRSSRSKRRRGDRVLHGSNREDGGDDSTEDSLDDEEEDEDEDAAVSAPSVVRLPSVNPMAPAQVSSMPNHHHHRKSFPPKVVRAAAPPWKVSDEMIGVSVPRKARSASAKRSHECWISGGGSGGEQILRQASTSPSRPSITPPAAPVSPSSSNASVRKKKPNGAKQKPPKISKATSSSSIQEIEIEVAEFLYGLTRNFQCPSKQESGANSSHKIDANGSGSDVKSRVPSPSPVPVSPPAATPSCVLPQNSSSATVPSSAFAPKRKRPRPVKLEEESPVSADPSVSTSSAAAAKTEVERMEKDENLSPKSERNAAMGGETGGDSSNFTNNQVHLHPDSVKSEGDPVPDSKLLIADSKTLMADSKPLVADSKPLVAESDVRERIESKDEISSPVKESHRTQVDDVNLDDATTRKEDSTACVVESLREEKFKIDLMAPPSTKSSPERDGAPGFEIDQKPSTPEFNTVPKMEILKAEEAKAEEGIMKPETGEAGSEEKKGEAVVDAGESQKQTTKERILDLQLDVEMQEKDGMSSTSKQQNLKQQQQSKAARIEPKMEKAAQPTSLSLPVTVPGWPGSLPLGYVGQVPSIQAVVSMDKSAGSSTAIQPPRFTPWPKRCATHVDIAKYIFYMQQLVRMNTFWPSPAGSGAMYGAQPYNLNAVPPGESGMLLNPMQGGLAGRNLSSLQDKGQATALGGNAVKEKSLPATVMDAQRKQLMLQQVPQPASANNILQAPAFIFPMNPQQVAAAAAATRSGTAKSGTTSNTSTSSAPANLIGGPVPTSVSTSSASVSFNYGSLPTNDAQYLAILQNNGYPFPIPAPVGAPTLYRGSHSQTVPFFNGSFYSPQMLHPSQLQQQQHPQSQPSNQQGHQNTTTSSGSSSSQKHQQPQQLLQACSSNGRGGSSQSFPPLKQQPQLQPQNQHLLPYQVRQGESNSCHEDSPSISNSRTSHSQKNTYNHSFALPMHPQNFTLMSPAALGGGSHGGEKSLQQHQSIKGGTELTPSQPFAMSFAPLNGTAAAQALDFSSVAQSHPVFQSLPEAAPRHGYQMAASAMAASAMAAQTAQKKNHPNMEEGRAVSDSTKQNASGEEDKKTMAVKVSAATIPQSIVFSRSERDPPMCTILSNCSADNSSRAQNLIPASTNGNRPSSRSASVTTSTPGAPAVVNAPNSTAHPQQQLIQLQQQFRQQPQLGARTKPSATNNTSVYSDRLPSSVMAKFPNAVPGYPLQGNSPNQSPQWKNSPRAGTAPVPPVQSPAAPMQSIKSLPPQGKVQVQGLPSSNQTQISFAVNPKAVMSGQPPSAQQLPGCSPAIPSAGIVGPPPTSISKSSNGSPRTSAAGSKVSQTAATMPSQPVKNSQPSSSRKSSPVESRNVPSILSNSHVTSAQSSIVKPQQQNQHQQPQLQKQPFQPAQFFFPNTFLQTQPPHSATANAAAYYQRRQSEQQPPQQNSPAASSSGATSVGSQSLTPPVSGTSDPAKAVAAATVNNLKPLPPPSLLQAAQFAAFPYIHAMPAVPVKPAEPKPAARNDNLNASSWQPEKR